MKLRWLKRLCRLALLIAVLGAVLFYSCLVSGLSLPSFLRVVAVESQAACRDAGTQWMVAVCLGIYLVAFLVLERRMNPNPKGWRLGDSKLWFGALAFLALAQYALAYQVASSSTELLVLLAGMALCKGARVWVRWAGGQIANVRRIALVLGILVVLLAGGACWQPRTQAFQYREQQRWNGPWENPNTYGMLMGVGVVLAIGQAVLSLKSKARSLGKANARPLTPALSPLSGNTSSGFATFSPSDSDQGSEAAMETDLAEVGNARPVFSIWRWVEIILFVTAAGLCGVGLVKSYSRGAWVGATCGLVFLLWNWIKTTAHLTPALSSLSQEHLIRTPSTFSPSDAKKGAPGGYGGSLSCSSYVSWFKRNWQPVCVILTSVLLLAFWNFRHTERVVARRAFSVGNVNDFSWRNRVAAHEGALQIMANKPWLGRGWNQPEPVYYNLYQSSKLAEGMAIQMNDYFMLGMTLGLPALICFIAYVWLCLTRNTEMRSEGRYPACGTQESEIGNQKSEIEKLDWLKATCRAGAIVLLVGFWFDGGLFKLATAGPFWILLELGRRD